MDAFSGFSETLHESILQRRVDVLLFDRDRPQTVFVFGGERLQLPHDVVVLNGIEEAVVEQGAGVADRRPDVMGNESFVEQVIVADAEGEHGVVRGLSLVPKSLHVRAPKYRRTSVS